MYVSTIYIAIGIRHFDSYKIRIYVSVRKPFKEDTVHNSQIEIDIGVHILMHLLAHVIHHLICV